MIIIGCDPDSDKSGIAVYENGKLINCLPMSLIGIYSMLGDILITYEPSEVELHIENVKGQNAAFAKHGVKNRKAATAISRNIGMCQQVQTEIERIAEHFDIKVFRHPISKQWKKNKADFERVTGWTGRSNEDSRSAAWFGYQGVLMNKGK